MTRVTVPIYAEFFPAAEPRNGILGATFKSPQHRVITLPPTVTPSLGIKASL